MSTDDRTPLSIRRFLCLAIGLPVALIAVLTVVAMSIRIPTNVCVETTARRVSFDVPPERKSLTVFGAQRASCVTLDKYAEVDLTLVEPGGPNDLVVPQALKVTSERPELHPNVSFIQVEAEDRGVFRLGDVRVRGPCRVTLATRDPDRPDSLRLELDASNPVFELEPTGPFGLEVVNSHLEVNGRPPVGNEDSTYHQGQTPPNAREVTVKGLDSGLLVIAEVERTPRDPDLTTLSIPVRSIELYEEVTDAAGLPGAVSDELRLSRPGTGEKVSTLTGLAARVSYLDQPDVPDRSVAREYVLEFTDLGPFQVDRMELDEHGDLFLKLSGRVGQIRAVKRTHAMDLRLSLYDRYIQSPTTKILYAAVAWALTLAIGFQKFWRKTLGWLAETR